MTFTQPGQAGTSDLSVGGYRILARIGEGGMGVVHLAESADGRRVALKVLRPHIVGDDEARQRLAREVVSLRQVHSGHVAEILDADPWGEIPYVVTRYVPGHSLDETVRRTGALSTADLQYAARRLLEAVRDVHAADVLHRDIKPTNVVMEGRAPILIDFGLARLAEDPRLTATGWLLGTPGYLAPEIVLGDQATAATDVHGWAATMVYAATGVPPYGRGHTMAILDRTRRGETDLKGVPDRLRPVLAACLSVEPLDRPTVAEVCRELDGLTTAALTTQVLAAMPTPTPPLLDATMPWQLVPADDPATEVISAVPSLTTPIPTPLTTPYTVLAPAPGAAGAPGAAVAPRVAPAPQPAQLSPAAATLRPLTGWVRLRRSLLLLGLGVVVATSFRLLPYGTLAALALAVVALRGLSRSQEAAWRRRSARGQRWSDAPRAVVGYPWHALRGSVGALVLVGSAGVTTGVVAGLLAVLGSTNGDALLVGGAVLAAATWCGPGSRRVHQPVRRAAVAVAREPLVWWGSAACLVVLTVTLCLAFVQAGVTWTPGTGAPWRDLRRLVPDGPPWL